MNAPINSEDFINRLIDIIARRGNDAYLGEPVSQQQHFLQAAWLAESADCESHTIVAALLHDVGHFTGEFAEDALEQGINNHHDACGERLLTPWFPRSVSVPVGLHVNAKRYLCAVESDYFQSLSPASVHSLRLQGGPMTESEVVHFEALEYFAEGVQVRRFDDQAKDPLMPTPPLEHFLPMVRRALLPERAS